MGAREMEGTTVANPGLYVAPRPQTETAWNGNRNFSSSSLCGVRTS